MGAHDPLLGTERSMLGPRERLEHIGALEDAHIKLALAAIEHDGPHGEGLRAVLEDIPGPVDCLFTSLAGDGYNGLSLALERATANGDLFNFLLAYFDFAIVHRPYFEVMARPDLYDRLDPVIQVARQLMLVSLVPATRRTVGEQDVEPVARAAWSFTEGFARLWVSGAFDPLLDSPNEHTGLAVALAHGGVYSALQHRFPRLPSVLAVERAGQLTIHEQSTRDRRDDA